jgi:hypothetical protein
MNLDDMAELRPRLERAFDFAANQVRATIERDPDFFPIYTTNGRWKHSGESWTEWCAGFHAGMMWIFAEGTGDLWWRGQAERYSKLLEQRQHDRNVHDLGFIFLNTYLPWYRATGDDRLRQVLIAAGRTLALRFNQPGQYLRSFVAPESLFIDIMMNVPLIFYAARETGDDELYNLAVAHCRTTERTLVRADGSTAHEGIFDPETRPGLADWPGRFTVSARFSASPRTPLISRSPSAMPTTTSPAARPLLYHLGTSMSLPVPTASTTARPPPSRPQDYGTWPGSRSEATRRGRSITAKPR